MSEFRRLMMAKKVGGGLPAGVVLYDWIATDGKAFINTGVIGNAPLYSEVSFRWSGGSASSPDSVILGARKDSNNTRIFLSALNQVNLGIGVGSYMTLGAKLTDSMKYGYLITQYTTIAEKGSSYLTVAELAYMGGNATTSTTPPITNLPLYLFRNNYSTASYCSPNLHLENAVIWTDDTKTNKLFDPHPCTYNGVAGVWDMVSNRFFGNANSSGSFTVGNN